MIIFVLFSPIRFKAFMFILKGFKGFSMAIRRGPVDVGFSDLITVFTG